MKSNKLGHYIEPSSLRQSQCKKLVQASPFNKIESAGPIAIIGRWFDNRTILAGRGCARDRLPLV